MARVKYDLRCNWKVVCDNYLDGGYHVPFAHKDLASNLDIAGYESEVHEKLSIQRCRPKAHEANEDHSAGVSEPSSGISGTASASRAPEAGSLNGNGAAALAADRLTGGRDAAYVFVYPNLMINRCGARPVKCRQDCNNDILSIIHNQLCFKNSCCCGGHRGGGSLLALFCLHHSIGPHTFY